MRHYPIEGCRIIFCLALLAMAILLPILARLYKWLRVRFFEDWSDIWVRLISAAILFVIVMVIFVILALFFKGLTILVTRQQQRLNSHTEEESKRGS